MGYTIDAVTADCYEGTSCLINKFGIMDEKQLEQVEADITMGNISELEKTPISGSFDTQHYKSIHHYLFQDLYDWAGNFRTINISKKGTRFADVTEIESLCHKCFKRLKECNYYQEMSFDEFVENIVDLYCSLNYIHPFREGNGRTQRIFITQLIRKNGYDINFFEIDPDYLMIATIQSAQGVVDNLINLFKKAIIKI